jgi:hypothetical protein
LTHPWSNFWFRPSPSKVSHNSLAFSIAHNIIIYTLNPNSLNYKHFIIVQKSWVLDKTQHFSIIFNKHKTMDQMEKIISPPIDGKEMSHTGESCGRDRWHTAERYEATRKTLHNRHSELGESEVTEASRRRTRRICSNQPEEEGGGEAAKWKRGVRRRALM